MSVSESPPAAAPVSPKPADPQTPMTALMCQGVGVIAVVAAILSGAVLFIVAGKSTEAIWALSGVPGGLFFWALGDIVEGVWRRS